MIKRRKHRIELSPGSESKLCCFLAVRLRTNYSFFSRRLEILMMAGIKLKHFTSVLIPSSLAHSEAMPADDRRAG